MKVVLYSEVIDGEETRKVEVYRDGRMDYACEGVEAGPRLADLGGLVQVERILC